MASSRSQTAQYYVSYAEANSHSFIIISKSTGRDPVVLASFGFYGENERTYSSVLTFGKISDNGRIRSEDYYLRKNKDVYVKSYLLSAERAMMIMLKVQEEAKINALLKKNPGKKQEGNAINGMPTYFNYLTEEERKLSPAFFQLNKNQRGGPKYNGNDFNCKTYAIYILRKLGIIDPTIEKGRFPIPSFQSNTKLAPAFFYNASKNTGIYWESDLNVCDLTEAKQEFPQKYNETFSKYQDPIEGAIAILKDYVSLKNSFLHPKRHHIANVKKVIEYIEKHRALFLRIETMVTYTEANLENFRDMTGSIQKRLDFLKMQIKNQPPLETRTPLPAPVCHASESWHPTRR